MGRRAVALEYQDQLMAERPASTDHWAEQLRRACETLHSAPENLIASISVTLPQVHSQGRFWATLWTRSSPGQRKPLGTFPFPRPCCAISDSARLVQEVETQCSLLAGEYELQAQVQLQEHTITVRFKRRRQGE